MAIHLVGETIDAKRAHQRAQVGELIQLMRGIYIEQDVDADVAILSHAVRIAHYLYPKAYLSSASAALLTPTPDGRLCISGRRNQRARLGSLEIVQNEAPPHPSTAAAVVEDLPAALSLGLRGDNATPICSGSTCRHPNPTQPFPAATRWSAQ
jgi:serine/threonine-protein kinase HipA